MLLLRHDKEMNKGRYIPRYLCILRQMEPSEYFEDDDQTHLAVKIETASRFVGVLQPGGKQQRSGS